MRRLSVAVAVDFSDQPGSYVMAKLACGCTVRISAKTPLDKPPRVRCIGRHTRALARKERTP